MFNSKACIAQVINHTVFAQKMTWNFTCMSDRIRTDVTTTATPQQVVLYITCTKCEEIAVIGVTYKQLCNPIGHTDISFVQQLVLEIFLQFSGEVFGVCIGLLPECAKVHLYNISINQPLLHVE